MQNDCVKPGPLSLLRLSSLVAVALILSGCTTSAPVAMTAPQSNLSRASAVQMAQRTAEAAGGNVFMVAPTGSMKPTLDENSVVAVERVFFAQLRQGDIVIYRSAAGQPIVHRLRAQVQNNWQVLGDNNSAVDREMVTPANLLGRVCAIFYTSPGSQGTAPAALAQR